MKHDKLLRGVVFVMCVFLIVLIVAVIMSPNSYAYDGNPIRTERQETLHKAADILRSFGYADDSEPIKALGAAWMQEQEALDIVARVVMGEAGGCPWMHQVAVAAVVVNRINSPLFPNTAREVVAQPYQYTTLYLRGFDKTSRQCYEAAKKALDGESGVPEDVIWQAEFRQGKEVWWVSVVDTGWYKSTTYFCR